jgi:hypothetical protein
MELRITPGQIAPGHSFAVGDQSNIELFGQNMAFDVTTANFSGLEFEIKMIEESPSPSPVHMVNSWGEPSGDVWIPEDDKDEICPDCKGKGVIELFNSVERCSCQNE